jgi:hypothetical protein
MWTCYASLQATQHEKLQYDIQGRQRPTDELWASFINHSRSQRHQQPPRLPRPPHGRFTLRPLGQLPTCLVGRPDLQPLPFINSFVLKGSIAR